MHLKRKAFIVLGSDGFEIIKKPKFKTNYTNQIAYLTRLKHLPDLDVSRYLYTRTSRLADHLGTL